MTAPLLLSGCPAVPIKDEIVYGNKGMLGAVEYHTLTNGQVELTFEQWMQLLKTKPLACVSVDAVADLKAAIELLCSRTACDYNTEAAAETLFTNLIQVKP